MRALLRGGADLPPAGLVVEVADGVQTICRACEGCCCGIEEECFRMVLSGDTGMPWVGADGTYRFELVRGWDVRW